MQELHLAWAKGRGGEVREILYPYALDRGGNVVDVERADRGGLFTCIGCGERMILKRGEIKVAHFAHWREVEGCGGETVLHKMAKAAIKYEIERAIEEGRPYGFSWMCSVCEMEHWGDLAVSEREIRVEAELDGVRPDLLAVSLQGKPLVAIEVIVSHYPEREAVVVYLRLELPVVMVRMGWDRLKELSEGLGKVEVLNARCRAKRCDKCDGIVEEIEIGSLYGYPCWKCGKKMRVLVFDGGMPFTEWGTPKWMIGIARELGVELKSMYSRTVGHSYIAHSCPSCGAIQGDWYVYSEPEWLYGVEDTEPDRSIEFYYCEACDICEKKERTADSSAARNNIKPLRKGGLTDAAKTNTS